MLVVEHLAKNFGTLKAVQDLSFEIKDGEILGLVGQNGSGKTTTFRMLLGLMQPTAGKVLWDGEKIGEKQKDLIGYLPEERGLYPKETIEQQVMYFGKLRGKKHMRSKKSSTIGWSIYKLKVTKMIRSNLYQKAISKRSS